MSELGISSLKNYLEHIAFHPDELSVLSKEFLINVSGFFRDKEAFEEMRDRIIPEIMKNKTPDASVKAWSVACSTGEEAYSIAILFREWLENNNLTRVTVKIFATDIDTDALETANKGIYSRAILQDVQGIYLAKYFVPEGNAYRVHPEIRKMVVFSHHDILKDPPFGRMDLISCRNMLIYINPEQQKEILRKLHFALNIGAYLFLGSSENIGILKNATEEINRKWKIFKCVSKNRLDDFPSYYVPLDKRFHSISQPRQKNPLQHIPELFTETLLEGHRCAGLFVNTEYEVKQATGNYKRFIDFPESGFNFNLLKMVAPELSIAISVTAGKAMRDNRPLVTKGVRTARDGQEITVDIIVKPYLTTNEYQQPFLFITLEERETVAEAVKDHSHQSFSKDERVQELEAELMETRSNLQLLLEEVETSNEELRSINEEAISTNEELQSTNEELQSLNEELHTVSSEHQLKIKELSELNDDLNNYFNNSEVGQILIDKDLIIRKFSPSVSKMINLIDADVNRSIGDITTRIKNVDFISDIKQVIRTGKPKESEVMLNDDMVYLMRIKPYIRQDHSMDGVVVNFIDISELRRLHSIVKAVFDSSPYGISAKKAIRDTDNQIIDFEYIAANEACENLYGLERNSLVGKRMKDYDHFTDAQLEEYKKVVLTGQPHQFEIFEPRLEKWLEVSLARMMDGVVTTVIDITERKKANQLIEQSFENLKFTSGRLAETNSQLQQSNLDLMQFASIASHDLKEPLRKIETFGNLLNEKIKSRLEEKELNYLQKIIRASSRMQSLVEDVLVFSKLSNNELPLSKVDLNLTLHQIIDDLEITIRHKNASIELGQLPSVKAVPGQMHQLFQNLISNALKFNDKKRPLISVQQYPVSPVHAKQLRLDGNKYAAIHVKDNGIGIEDQFKEKIFGIFQRLNGNQYEGTGIGLAVCKKIVENNKGHLLLESQPGIGSEFIIILPLFNS
jgi:two-component system CheB/CheR fusion protein